MKRILKDKLVITMVGTPYNRAYALFGPVYAKYQKNMKGSTIYELGSYAICLAKARKMQEQFPNWSIEHDT